MAQDFMPFDILAGHDIVASRLQKNWEAVEAKFPVQAKDIDSVPMRRADWAGATVPTDALNIDELFNRATGIAAFLGCFDIVRGMRLVWLSATTFGVDVGQVTHRARFMRQTLDGCHEPATCPIEITPGSVLIPGECAPSEANPSGLDYGDGTLWYYVYAKLDIAGTAPEFRISGERPVWCEGKGPEHPTLNLLRYIGALKTGPGGVIKPFICYGNGWTLWSDATPGIDSGVTRSETGSYVRIGQNETESDSNGNSRRADIPPTADAVKVFAAHVADADNPSVLDVRPTKSEADLTGGYRRLSGQRNRFIGDEYCTLFAGPAACFLAVESENNDAEAEFDVPVNMCSQGDVERQSFQYAALDQDSNATIKIDVTAYHEPHLL